MAVGVAHAPLVSVQRDEPSGDVEHIDSLLQEPVDVVDVGAAAAVMLAHAEVVELGDIHRIPVGVVLGAVVVSVAGILGVPVRVASVDPVRLAFRPDLVGPDACDILALVRMLLEDPQLVAAPALELERVDGAVRQRQPGCKDLACS